MKVEEELRNMMHDLEKGHSDEEFTQGLWKAQLLFKPNENERVFEYTYLLAQTVGQDAATAVAEHVSTGNGSVRTQETRSHHGCMRIAVLDAVFSVFDRHPANFPH